MSEKPIIFSGEMVRAILDGRKTQTRRVVKITHKTPGTAACLDPPAGLPTRPKIAAELCPYGQPGDRLWVRETHMLLPPFSPGHDPTVLYRADNHQPDYIRPTDRWRPSIHMPRWASRVTLEITGIRVERVQDISSEDALAEGVGNDWQPESNQIATFQRLWDSINAKRGYGWDVNPSVWVIGFRVLSP